MKSTASDRRSNGRPLRIEALEARQLLAADFELLKDINQTPTSWNWTQAFEVGSRSFLIAGSRVLWSTDGTSAGSFQVHEAATTIRDLTNVNGTLFFAADSRYTPNGVELWKSDGTPAGTTLVKEIVPNDPNLTFTAEPRHLTNVNGTLFFSAYGGSAVRNDLWKSDGSESGTVIVADIRVGTSGSPFQLTNLNGTLYFNNGWDGGRIWKSDGTAAGTVAAYTATTTKPVIYNYTKVNETLFFIDYRPGSGRELWKYDSTTMATSLVASISPPSIATAVPHSLVNVGGTLFFVANDGVHGPELWKSDGTAAGTGMVKDVFAAANDSEHIQGLTVVGETLFFHAREGAGDRRLWKSDGTTAGTVPVSLEPLGAPGGFVIQPGAPMIEAGGKLYFQAYEPSSGEEIWSSDGTLAGTRLAYDVTPGPTSTSSVFLAEFDDTLLFKSPAGTLWKGDEQGAGATILNIPRNKTGASVQVFDALFTSMGVVTFFAAHDGIHGHELWRTDGTEAGTWLVKDVTPGSAGSTLKHFTVVGNLLYFTNENHYVDAELWKSDGTAAGTTLITTLARWTPSNPPRELVNVNGTLFFTADTPLVSTGVELWKSDGTVAGTKAITDMIPTGSTARVAHLSNVNGTLLFRGYQQATGGELWRSDGTAGGTTLVKEIYPGSGWGLPSGYTDVMPRVVADGILYFRAGYYEDQELWRSDGTANGTYLVKDIYAGSRGSELNKFCVVNNTIYFTAESETDFDEALWKTDGTAAGTVRVYSDSAFRGPPASLTNVDGTLFFTVERVWEGRELWKSDGTSAGTMLVKDIRIGEEDGGVSQLTNFGGTLYFDANDGLHGAELWRSDGTAAGTVMVRDFVPGPWSGSSPLFVADGRLLVVTNAEPYGSELWISTPERQGPADFDENGRVDGTDFLAWQRAYGATADPAGSGADGDGNGTVGSEDLGVWQNNFGAGGSASGSAAAAVGASELAMAALVADEEAVDDGAEQSGAGVGNAADAAFAWLAGDRTGPDRGPWRRSAAEAELFARDWAARSVRLSTTAGNALPGEGGASVPARKLRGAEFAFDGCNTHGDGEELPAAAFDPLAERSTAFSRF